MIISRRSTSGDVEQIAELLVQLYEAEAPGMIGEGRGNCTVLIARALRKSPGNALANSRVLSDSGHIVGFGAVATRDQPRSDLYYPGLDEEAAALLGQEEAAGFCRGMHRLMGVLLAPVEPHEGQLHSLVVDQAYRGSSVGSRMLRELENIAVGMGKTACVLHVLNGNTAELFYKKHGYTATRTGPETEADAGRYSSVVMEREMGKSTSVANPARVRA